MDEVSFKPWAACRHAHPAIDAALQLKREGALTGDILVETYADAVAFCDRPEPRTVSEAKFSIQHAVAVVAARGEPTPADFELAAIEDDAIAEVRARIVIKEAGEISARYPAHFGARLSAGPREVDLVDTLGDPERPLGDQGVIAKARSLIAWGGLPEAEAERAVAAALESGSDTVDLLRLLEDWL
jgi:2-methylcitrate dehydratase PrpD